MYTHIKKITRLFTITEVSCPQGREPRLLNTWVPFLRVDAHVAAEQNQLRWMKSEILGDEIERGKKNRYW